ncbi:MAG: hypothetical protein WC533_03345 [Candidatus Pacearchaeota archaeon]
MKTALIIVVLLLINIFFIVSNENLQLSNSENIKQVFSIYVEWVGKIFTNLGSVTSNAIKLNWTPGE